MLIVAGGEKIGVVPLRVLGARSRAGSLLTDHVSISEAGAGAAAAGLFMVSTQQDPAGTHNNIRSPAPPPPSPRFTRRPGFSGSPCR